MKLSISIDRYIAWRRLHGARFENESGILEKFRNRFDSEINCNEVACADVRQFLADAGPRVHSRIGRYRVLSGFYRYAVSRGFVPRSPLPARETEPKTPKPRLPHVYSCDELARLFGKIQESRKKALKLDELTFRTLLWLLYGTGLRIGEALRLTMADVDLNDAVVTVRRTKFNKSRMVPLGDQLCEVMRSYAEQRMRRKLPEQADSRFLADLDGTPLRYRTVKGAFQKLLAEAQIQPAGDGFQNPNLHSFRHTFAVNRVTAWYRNGDNVQQLLPALSACLGHASPEGTRVYLSMTPDLLREASLRFDKWVNGGCNE